jgi:sensor histidine kinase YesM
VPAARRIFLQKLHAIAPPRGLLANDKVAFLTTPDTLSLKCTKTMMPTDTTNHPCRPPFPWKKFGVDFLFASMFNVGVALVFTLLMSGGHFWVNLVASMCIGTIAFLLIDGTHLFWQRGEEKYNWPRMIAVIAVTVPSAQWIGGALTGWLLGVRVTSITDIFSAHASAILMFTLLATVLATILFTSRERLMRSEAIAARESARAEAIARQALQAQLKLLQAQLEPHMLFNTLANLQGLIALDPARAQQMLDQLIVYLRATLSSSRSDVTTLAQEFALMDAYLSLMSVRMGARLTFDLELPPALRDARIPPMLLQPLVENAIGHGLEPKIEGGRVVVSATSRDGILLVSVSDDGLGLDAPSARSGTHLGLATTRSRLYAIHGDQASLTLAKATAGGALAQITLPLVTA